MFRDSCIIIVGAFMLYASVSFAAEVKKDPQTIKEQQAKNEGS